MLKRKLDATEGDLNISVSRNKNKFSCLRIALQNYCGPTSMLLLVEKIIS